MLFESKSTNFTIAFLALIQIHAPGKNSDQFDIVYPSKYDGKSQKMLSRRFLFFQDSS